MSITIRQSTGQLVIRQDDVTLLLGKVAAQTPIPDPLTVGELRVTDGTDYTRLLTTVNGGLDISTPVNAAGSITIRPDNVLNLGTTGTDFVNVGRTSGDVPVTIAGTINLRSVAANITLSPGGTARWLASSNRITGTQGASAAILNEIATTANPTLVPQNTDLTTGVGADGLGGVSLIASGVEALRIAETSGRADITAGLAGCRIIFDGGDDSDTYISGNGTNDQIDFTTNGNLWIRLVAGGTFGSASNGRPTIRFGNSATPTTPNIHTRREDVTTGLGGSSGTLALIASGATRLVADAGGVAVAAGVSAWGVTPPVAQPTITGSRGGNAALASLLTALAATGLIVDGSSA